MSITLSSAEIAELAHERKEAEWEQKKALYEEAAKEQLKTRLFQIKPGRWDSLDTLLAWLMDEIVDQLEEDWSDFREAVAMRDKEAIGQCVLDALERTADNVADSKPGQMKVDDIISEMAEEAGR